MNPIQLQARFAHVRTPADVQKAIRIVNRSIHSCQQTINQLSTQYTHARTSELKELISNKKEPYEKILLQLNVDLIHLTQLARIIINNTQRAAAPVKATKLTQPDNAKIKQAVDQFIQSSTTQKTTTESTTTTSSTTTNQQTPATATNPPTATANQQTPLTTSTLPAQNTQVQPAASRETAIAPVPPKPVGPEPSKWFTWKTLFLVLFLVGGGIFVYRNRSSIGDAIKRFINFLMPQKQSLPAADSTRSRETIKQPGQPNRGPLQIQHEQTVTAKVSETLNLSENSKGSEIVAPPQLPPCPPQSAPTKSNKEMKKLYDDYHTTIMHYWPNHKLDWLLRHKKIPQELYDWICSKKSFKWLWK